MNLAVIFGGMSNEHDVSIKSANNVVDNLNRDKYDITLIYIDKNGEWYQSANGVVLEEIDFNKWEKIDNIVGVLKKCDVVFPILHGKYGEDGTIQGLLELLKIPYVGCGVLASAIAMDKVSTKILLEKAGISQAKYLYIRRLNQDYVFVDNNLNETVLKLEDICSEVEKNLSYPIFVKPSNSGSSVGVSKVYNKEELIDGILLASKTDNKILLEENIVGKEIECAVLGNEDVKASCLGEVKSASNFYSYDAKYNDSNSKIIIPAELNEELTDRVREIAVKAMKAISGSGIARVDFFVNENTEDIYLNEINTMPGFTSISMYPKLWEHSGISYHNLLDKLIDLALEKKK